MLDDEGFSAGPSTLSDWTVERSVPSLSTNAGAIPIAFQDWRKFKEAFAPELVANAVDETERELRRPVTHVVDPFGGSGTTALTSQFLSKCCSTIEVNPFLADLIEAKLASYDFGEVMSAYLDVLTNLRSDAEGPIFHLAPKSFVEPGHQGRYVFPLGVAVALRNLIWTIDARVFDPNIRRFLRVLAISLSVDVSNVVISGKGRRYRRNWQENCQPSSSVLAAFKRKVESALYDIRRFGQRRTGASTVLRGDARELASELPPFDLAIFSPPYPNSFDYTDVYNVELWVGGYLDAADANRTLRKQTLRSHVQIARDFSCAELPSPTLKSVLERLDEVSDRLWNKHIPAMIAAYMDDMRNVISELRKRVCPGGRIYMVVGDSQYAGVSVPVTQMLIEVCAADGLTVLSAQPFRSMRVSPQQGGTEKLPETLIVLRRDWE